MADTRLDSLMPKAYAELRRLAAYHLRLERSGHTLRPTDLVHEAYLRLRQQHSIDAASRVEFMSLASMMMRRILVDHAKRRGRQKRGNGVADVPIDDAAARTQIDIAEQQVDVLALEEALVKLAKLDPRQVQIVEFHFFGGLTFDEIAELLGVSLSTVMREWRLARNWLYLQLKTSAGE